MASRPNCTGSVQDAASKAMSRIEGSATSNADTTSGSQRVTAAPLQDEYFSSAARQVSVSTAKATAPDR